VTDTYFPLLGDDHSDDLPRTLRRERDAREREAREREAKARGPTLARDYRGQEPAFAAAPMALAPATVMRFDVPFTHLVRFFLKSALAALPALILLGTMLWVTVTLVRTNYPDGMLASQTNAAMCRTAAAAADPALPPAAAPAPLARVTANSRPTAAEAKAAPVRKRVAADKVKMTRN
jgi:hypothetical protein